MKLKITYTVLIGLLLSAQLYGQYNWFSQYEYNLINNNPAIIANDNCLKLVTSFKNNTITTGYQNKLSYFSAELPFKLSKKSDHIGGAGITFMDDNYSSENIYRRTGISLTHGQSLKITSRSYLSAGINLEYYQRRINTEGFTTGSQWIDNQGYDPAADLGEPGVYNKVNVFNLSGGVYWRLLDVRKKVKAHASLAIYNMNQPNESVYDEEGKLPMRFTLSGSYKVFEKNNLTFTPDLLVNSQGPEQFITVGGLVNYSFTNESPFSLIKSGSIDYGVRYTYDYSTALIFRLNQKHTIAGVNIDLGTSKSSKYGFKGNTFEVLLVLRMEVFDRTEDENLMVGKMATNDGYQIGETRGFIEQSQLLKESQVTFAQDNSSESRPDKPVKVKLEKDFKFSFNKAELNDEAKEYMDEIVILLNFNRNLKLEIIGHTDNVGSKEANQKLSEERARIVYEYILSKGINKKRLQYTGKADDDPVAPNNSSENRAKNRRVEFILYTD